MVTSGLKCAPDTAPNMRIRPTSAPAVANAFSNSCRPTSPGESRCAMIPDPITATTSSAVPRASAASRRARSRRSAPVPVSGAAASASSGTGSSALMPRVRSTRDTVDPLGELGDGAVERGRRAVGHRIGHRPVEPVGPVAQLLVGAVAHRHHERCRRATRAGRRRGRAAPRSRPARRAAATAPGCTPGAGWVPADDAARRTCSVHNAAASWLRAELCGAHEQRPAGTDQRRDRTSGKAAGRRCT